MTALFLVITAFSASPQAPAAEAPVIGVWVLKTATVNGKNATSKELTEFLKNHGGAEIGMMYKFRKKSGLAGEESYRCVLNDLEQNYEYKPETKEVVVLAQDKTGKEYGQGFDVRFVQKNMKLRFKEKGKVVEMTFAHEE
jgi:hypothetical protein